MPLDVKFNNNNNNNSNDNKNHSFRRLLGDVSDQTIFCLVHVAAETRDWEVVMQTNAVGTISSPIKLTSWHYRETFVGPGIKGAA